MEYLGERFDAFLNVDSCQQIIKNVQLRSVSNMNLEEQVRALAFFTYVNGYAAGSNLPLKEAAEQLILGCEQRLDEPFVGAPD